LISRVEEREHTRVHGSELRSREIHPKLAADVGDIGSPEILLAAGVLECCSGTRREGFSSVLPVNTV
jgi:hypothetical protein